MRARTTGISRPMVSARMIAGHCYLAGTPGVKHSPTIKIFLNLPEMLDRVGMTASKLASPTAFYLGKLQDGLALDPLTGYSRRMIPFFARQPQARLILLTKSTSVETCSTWTTEVIRFCLGVSTHRRSPLLSSRTCLRPPKEWPPCGNARTGLSAAGCAHADRSGGGLAGHLSALCGGTAGSVPLQRITLARSAATPGP